MTDPDRVEARDLKTKLRIIKKLSRGKVDVKFDDEFWSLAVGDRSMKVSAYLMVELTKLELVLISPHNVCELTDVGRSWLRRQLSGGDDYRVQHGMLEKRPMDDVNIVGDGHVSIDIAESPIGWLFCRKDRNGVSYINADQFGAGERLRSDFTRGKLLPSVTSSWGYSMCEKRNRRSGNNYSDLSDSAMGARQRVHNALNGVGPEFSGLLVDVCCFLKKLEDVERDRGWPSRSAKIVLRLGLDRLSRYYDGRA